MSQVQPCSGDHPGGDVGREGEENIYSRQVKWAHRTLWMRPSLKMELLIFLNSSYRASTSLTLTAPSPHLKPVRETFAYICIYIYIYTPFQIATSLLLKHWPHHKRCPWHSVLHALELDIVLLTIEKIPFILEYTFNSFNLNSPGFMHNKLDTALQYLTISKCHVSEGRMLNMQSDMVKLSSEWAREREREIESMRTRENLWWALSHLLWEDDSQAVSPARIVGSS
jgi:hypothetical protein